MEKESTLMDFNENEFGSEVELPSFARKYTNVKTEIEGYELHKGSYKGEDSYYLRVFTAPVGKEIIKDKETKQDKEIEIRASRNFGVILQDGKYVWGSQSKLGKFMRKHGLTKISELTKVKVVTNIEVKDESEYLSYV
jgi:hypothetical protein